MSEFLFAASERWPLQGEYKQALHERIQQWGERVAPALMTIPPQERTAREPLFRFLMESVARDDHATATIIEGLDMAAREWLEGLGGSIDSDAGHRMCQQQFEGLYGIQQARI